MLTWVNVLWLLFDCDIYDAVELSIFIAALNKMETKYSDFQIKSCIDILFLLKINLFARDPGTSPNILRSRREDIHTFTRADKTIAYFSLKIHFKINCSWWYFLSIQNKIFIQLNVFHFIFICLIVDQRDRVKIYIFKI